MYDCKFYLSMNIDDLRRQLASRNLPTEGLKRDLAWRLATLDNPLDRRSLGLPRPASASSSNGGGMLAETKYHRPATDFRNRTSKPTWPSTNDSSRSSIHQHSQKKRRISNLAPLSISLTKAFLSIVSIVFLSCILWYCIPMENREYFSKSVDNGYKFLIVKINDFQDFIGSPF